jgi:hypothetical protein
MQEETKILIRKLRDKYKELSMFQCEQAKQHALEAIVGREADKQNNTEFAKTAWKSAKIWEEAAKIAHDLL